MWRMLFEAGEGGAGLTYLNFLKIKIKIRA